MKISRYIQQLQNYYKLYGDIEIVDKCECSDYKYRSAMPFPTVYKKQLGIINNADKQPKIGEIMVIQGFEWDKEISHKMDNINKSLKFIDI